MIRLIKLILILGFGVMLSCIHKNKGVVEPPSKPVEPFGSGRKGCFLLYNIKTNTFEKTMGEDVCRESFPACSTFKVPLAVIAFDSGILKNETQILKWDGKKDSRDVANKNHTAKTWMSDSIVWFSQRITKKLGEPKLQTYLNNFNYGNKDLSAGLSEAWLVSPAATTAALKISAYEQVEFMKKLWSNSLPVSKKAMTLTQDITYLETSPNGFKLNGKTGSNFYDQDKKQHFGWFIAHIQKEDKEYISVVNISDLQPSTEDGYGGYIAKDLTKKFLTAEGLW